MKKAISTPDAPGAIGTYSQAVRAGDTVYLSGQIPLDPKTMQIVEGFDNQVRRVFDNLQAVCRAAGGDFDKVVRVTVYLTDMKKDFPTYNRLWAEYFKDVPTPPCRTTLGITALPTPISIELKCIAVLPEGS